MHKTLIGLMIMAFTYQASAASQPWECKSQTGKTSLALTLDREANLAAAVGRINQTGIGSFTCQVTGWGNDPATRDLREVRCLGYTQGEKEFSPVEVVLTMATDSGQGKGELRGEYINKQADSEVRYVFCTTRN